MNNTDETLNKVPQGEGVPKSHLKWECDSKSNIIARFTPSPPRPNTDPLTDRQIIYLVYTHLNLKFYPWDPSTIVPLCSRPYHVRTVDLVHMVLEIWLPNCLKFIHLYWYTWWDMWHIYLCDSDTCHTMSHVTLHQAVKNGNMKSLMIKWVFPHWFD